MNTMIALVCFPVIFVGEIPDKTMFASLLLATRGKPLQVWVGAALAFVVHVTIAVTVGVALFEVAPHRVVEVVVASAFFVGAVVAWREAGVDGVAKIEAEQRRHGTAATAFIVVFVAEWGDLTQLLTANLAARYHAALWVGIGSVAALWSVAGLAVVGGSSLLRVVKASTLRRVMALTLTLLALSTGWAALR